jgi:hypothetical protein
VLVNEREVLAIREEGLTARIWGLETAVTDSLRDLLRKGRFREMEWKSRLSSAALDVAEVIKELAKRNMEMRMTFNWSRW